MNPSEGGWRECKERKWEGWRENDCKENSHSRCGTAANVSLFLLFFDVIYCSLFFLVAVFFLLIFPTLYFPFFRFFWYLSFFERNSLLRMIHGSLEWKWKQLLQQLPFRDFSKETSEREREREIETTVVRATGTQIMVLEMRRWRRTRKRKYEEERQNCKRER